MSIYAAFVSGFYRRTGALAFVTGVVPMLIVFAVLIFHIMNARRKGVPIKTVFSADLRWGPELSTDRLRAFHEERAARVND
ncbi:unnamed protein product [Gongylonema pulchrum]|uniref:RDD family protein n=1 Tax=Gongylonema pulchrum TaxID=637853 RepID=A0A183DXT7_9BILA|nr:unnamed protein product [Gongylonema pulchrum]